MNSSTLKDYAELVAVFLVWVVGLFTQWTKLINKINGVGSKVNAQEITVGQHEARLDRIESEQTVASADRKQLFKDVGEFRAEVASLNKTCRESDEKNNLLLTAIQVEIGKLGTKVDILLQERNK